MMKMKNLLYLVPILVLVLGASLSAATANIPMSQWKMDSTVPLGTTGRDQVPNEIDPGPGGLVMGEGTMANWPVLTADGGGVTGLPGDRALDFTTNPTAAYNNTLRTSSYYPGIDIAFEFDLYPRSVTDEQTLMFATGSWEFRIKNSQLIFYVNRASDGSLASVRTAITANAWHHVYAESVGEDLLLTVDGVTVAKVGDVTGGRQENNNRFYMGFAGSKTSPIRVSTAIIDELTMYEVVWTQDLTIAHTPTPSDGDDTVDPSVVTGLEWLTPLTQSDPNGDPNLVSIDQFDLTIYSKLTANVTGDDPNFVGVATVTNATSPYALSLAYDTTYFWRIDTHRTWDSNDFTGAGLSEIATGDSWQFAVMTAAPTVTQQPVNTRAFVTDPSVVLTCQFISASAPTVLWYQVGNPTPLSTGGDIVISTVNDGGNDYTTTLQILTPALADEGEYYCTIDNGTLVQSDDADLIINLLLAEYKFDGTLAPEAGSLGDAPTGQAKTLDGLAEPNELLATPTTASYDTGADGIGQALLLDPNDFVDLATAGYPKAGGVTNGLGRGLDVGTVIYWIKPNVSGAVLANYNDGGTTGFDLRVSGGEARMNVRSEAGQIGTLIGSPDRPGWDVFDGEWHMVAYTWESGVSAAVYVDGQPVASGNGGTSTIFADWQRAVLLGAGRTTDDRNILNGLFDGLIDNLRIYNYRLDADAQDVFAQEYYDNTGIVPCMSSTFEGDAFNFDNTGSSYCIVNLADFAEFAAAWLANALWDIP